MSRSKSNGNLPTVRFEDLVEAETRCSVTLLVGKNSVSSIRALTAELLASFQRTASINRDVAIQGLGLTKNSSRTDGEKIAAKISHTVEAVMAAWGGYREDNNNAQELSNPKIVKPEPMDPEQLGLPKGAVLALVTRTHRCWGVAHVEGGRSYFIDGGFPTAVRPGQTRIWIIPHDEIGQKRQKPPATFLRKHE